MKLGDFASIIQLGVGLHAGAALLQSIAEFAEAPLLRRITRLQQLAKLRAERDAEYSECVSDSSSLLGELEVKKIQFFNEYRIVVLINVAFAIVLCAILAAGAFVADIEISPLVGIGFVAASLVPASTSLVYLHVRWTTNTVTLETKVNDLERRLLGIQRERFKWSSIRRVSSWISRRS